MVKGISRQVIVVHSPDPKLFEQAIFILKDAALEDGGVTDEMLMKEAKRLISSSAAPKRRAISAYGVFWASCGALLTGLLWLVTSLI